MLTTLVPLLMLCRAHATGAGAAANNGQVVQFESTVRVIPHPAKAARGGEDAFFSHPFAIGVADGVGGWNEAGVDPSKYSRSLVAGSLALLESPAASRDPKAIMSAGYARSRGIVGSATFCVVALDALDPARLAAAAAAVPPVPPADSLVGLLRTANLGDSGFMLYRRDALVFRSKEQQKGFNFPFQLGQGSPDTPDVADLLDLPVQSGDLVIVGSDGLFDNVHDFNITQLVERHQGIAELADHLSAMASKHANDASYLSPFALNAARAGWSGMLGGKLDDITIVVARVRVGPPPQRTAGGKATAGSAVTSKDGKTVLHTLAASALPLASSDAVQATLRWFELSEFWLLASVSIAATCVWQLRRARSNKAARA